MKKKIAIMFAGQIRTNSLSGNNLNDNRILDSINKYLLNDDFKEKYDYDIFISTDQINIEKTKLFFGENLKNINITEDNWYYKSISIEVEPYEYFYNKYLDTIKNVQGCLQYTSSFYQNYRMYCAYKMILDYENKTNSTYDYYIKIRNDSILVQDFSQLIPILEENNIKICIEHDHLIIVNNEYTDIYNFIHSIGSYQNKIENSDGMFKHFFPPWGYELTSRDDLYFLCPERQMIEYIRRLANINNHNTKDIFLGINYPSFHLIYRGNNQYVHTEYTHDKIFEPLNSISYIKDKFN